MRNVIRIVVADDAEVVRTEVRAMFAADPRYRIVATVADGADLLELLGRVPCDLVLLDLTMPGKSGLQVLRDLADGRSTVPVVVLSVHDEGTYVDRALALGARGYVLKSAPKADIVQAIEAAVGDGVYLQPELTKAVLERNLVLASRRSPPHLDLTPRQAELLRGLALGLTNKELSVRIGVTQETVKGYLKDVYRRLGVTTRAGAVAVGIRRGLIQG